MQPQALPPAVPLLIPDRATVFDLVNVKFVKEAAK
jgi:hypothetical protein